MTGLPYKATTNEHMETGRYCWSCLRRMPSKYRATCGECFHAWRTGWHLLIHSRWVRWKLLGLEGLSGPWRPADVWVCPCCAHDL